MNFFRSSSHSASDITRASTAGASVKIFLISIAPFSLAARPSISAPRLARWKYAPGLTSERPIFAASQGIEPRSVALRYRAPEQLWPARIQPGGQSPERPPEGPVGSKAGLLTVSVTHRTGLSLRLLAGSAARLVPCFQGNRFIAYNIREIY